jgi:hypothetical protein
MMRISLKSQRLGVALRLLAIGGVMFIAACSTPRVGPSADAAPRTPDAQQRVFATPEEAVNALVAATRDDRKAELLMILGPRAEKLVHSGDGVADRHARERFIAAYDKAHEIESEGEGRDMLVVGEEEWPMPIPLAGAHGVWWFDTAAGEQEILNRRIGRNELNVIKTCRAYVEAQQEFAALHSLIGSRREYAQRFRSAEGQHDGLYWPVADGQPESPLGPLIANATTEGYSDKALGKHAPFHGYFYRILKSQGPHTSAGARDYVINGHMTRGFALLAFPARYGDSGVMTFIVNHNGIVYEKNLGPGTAKIARRITQFEPDESWNVAEEP